MHIHTLAYFLHLASLTLTLVSKTINVYLLFIKCISKMYIYTLNLLGFYGILRILLLSLYCPIFNGD
nr:MAG TPA: hypothetical protein [Caudoviricetes sp.]